MSNHDNKICSTNLNMISLLVWWTHQAWHCSCTYMSKQVPPNDKEVPPWYHIAISKNTKSTVIEWQPTLKVWNIVIFEYHLLPSMDLSSWTLSMFVFVIFFSRWGVYILWAPCYVVQRGNKNILWLIQGALSKEGSWTTILQCAPSVISIQLFQCMYKNIIILIQDHSII